MIIRIIIVLLLIVFASCTVDNKTVVQGDLYFKLIDFQGYYNAPDSLLVKIENSAKTVNKDTLSEQDKKIYGVLQFMIENKLLRKPFVRIRRDDGKVLMVYIDSDLYKKLNVYNHNDLVRDNKRIRLKLEASEIKYDSLVVYETTKVISIEKLDGITYWQK